MTSSDWLLTPSLRMALLSTRDTPLRLIPATFEDDDAPAFEHPENDAAAKTFEFDILIDYVPTAVTIENTFPIGNGPDIVLDGDIDEYLEAALAAKLVGGESSGETA